MSEKVLRLFEDAQEAWDLWVAQGDVMFVSVLERGQAELFHTICWDFASCVEACDVTQIYVFRVDVRANLVKKLFAVFGPN